MKELVNKPLNEKEMKQLLETIGAKEIEYYLLVNNWGFTFKYHDVEFDARFWENCYGTSPMIWTISHSKKTDNQFLIDFISLFQLMVNRKLFTEFDK